MLITKEVKMRITSVNKQYYLDLGYIIPTHTIGGVNKVKRGTEILVQVSDLPRHSEAKIEVYCDDCFDNYKSTVISKMFHNYIRDNRKHDGRDVCKSCAHLKMGKRYRKDGNDVYNYFISRGLTPTFSP